MEDDLRALEIGTIQVIRCRKTNESADERDILYLDPSNMDPTQYTRESGCRAFWYFLHSLLEDEQVQKWGLVALGYCEKFAMKNRDPGYSRLCFSCFQGCLPIRLSVVHICHSIPLFRLVARITLVFIWENARANDFCFTPDRTNMWRVYYYPSLAFPVSSFLLTWAESETSTLWHGSLSDARLVCKANIHCSIQVDEIDLNRINYRLHLLKKVSV
jgi:CRAL/TRIO domain